jgi:hypothetical protein
MHMHSGCTPYSVSVASVRSWRRSIFSVSPTASMPLSSSAHLLRTGGYCNADDRYTEKMDLPSDHGGDPFSPYTYHQHCSNPLYGVGGHCWIMALSLDTKMGLWGRETVEADGGRARTE